MSANYPLRPGKCSKKNVSNPERAFSALGGALLLLSGLKRRGPFGLLQSCIGTALIYRGISGQCSLYKALKINTYYGQEQADGIHIVKSVRIKKSVQDLYDFWTDFKNLPQIMSHVLKVEVRADNTLHWVAKAPAGRHVSWNARIINCIPNELIAWESLPESSVPNAGSVRFQDVGSGETQITVNLQYHPPAGVIGAAVAKLFGEDPSSQIADDLRRFKSIMETGQILRAAPSRPIPNFSR